MLVLVMGFAALASLLATVPAAAYRAARREQCTLTEPARRCRSMQRRPQRFFTRSLARWQAMDSWRFLLTTEEPPLPVPVC